MSSLKMINVNKVYPNGFQAIYDMNLQVEDNEFVVFVGPSGCGKSTALRMIAGLEEITEGEILIDEKVVNDVSPKDRDIAMVFQNYALYPHMTNYENMAFGLKLRKMPKDEIDKRVQEAAEILGLRPILKNKPKQLSGGQRQRVALGRAIVRNPKVFLMDEPLSNLDAKLRVQTRAEISKLHHRLKTTFIYVTHDQTEAMTMGTRIVVLKDGKVMQVDSPTNLYEKPENKFVGGFIGSPQMNFIEGKSLEKDGEVGLVYEGISFAIDKERQEALRKMGYSNKEIIIGIRPEHLNVEKTEKSGDTGLVEVTELLGSETYLFIKLKKATLVARVEPQLEIQVGDHVKVGMKAHKVHLFDGETEESILHRERQQKADAKE